jgi:IS30 family transposase
MILKAASQVIFYNLKAYEERVITLTYENVKEFADHARIVAELDLKEYFPVFLAYGYRGSSENLKGFFRHSFPINALYQQSRMMN